MTPITFPNQEARSIANLTEYFRDKTVTQGLVQTLARAIQKIENQLFSVLYSGLIGTIPVYVPVTEPDPETGLSNITGATLVNYVLDASGDALDQLGHLVGVVRNGLSDADFLVVVKVQILVNISKGTHEDIIGILRAAAPSGAVYSYIPLVSPGPGFLAMELGPSTPIHLFDVLKHVAPAGVPFWYISNASTLATTLYYADHSSTITVPGVLTWEDRISGGVGGKFANILAGD
jgi:hypothetical protein